MTAPTGVRQIEAHPRNLARQGSREPGYRVRADRLSIPRRAEDKTAFFGLALSRYLQPDATVILGTRGSQWSVLVEHLATEGADEDARLRLLEADASAAVEQSLLNALAPLMGSAFGCAVIPRLIPFGQDAGEQYDILGAIADAVPKGTVSFDLTHGFRHLGMIGVPLRVHAGARPQPHRARPVVRRTRHEERRGHARAETRRSGTCAALGRRPGPV